MPIYRYRCEACGNVDQLLAKISDPAPETCTECAKGPMRKTVSRTSFQLKGGGWYAEGYNSTTGKPDKDAAKSDSKSESKSESKTESKSTGESSSSAKSESTSSDSSASSSSSSSSSPSSD